MAKILSVSERNVKISCDDGTVIEVPISALDYESPGVGDEVEVYRDDKGYVVMGTGNVPKPEPFVKKKDDGSRSMNKHVFVWLGSFVFGHIGLDRFLRGQIGLGIFKLLLNWIGWITIIGGLVGISWVFVDWIIAMVKAYGSSNNKSEEISFDAKGNYLN